MATVFNTPGIKPVLATVILWMLAHNVLYTFIAPFITPAGLSNSVDTVLMTFGVAALAGILATGRMVNRQLRLAVLSRLAIFALVALLFIQASNTPVAIYLGAAVWGLTFGGAATLLQTDLADSAGNGADVALSMNVVAWNSAIAGAGVLGGVLLNTWGLSAFPWAVLGLTLAGFGVVWSARAHGFPVGPRPVVPHDTRSFPRSSGSSAIGPGCVGIQTAGLGRKVNVFDSLARLNSRRWENTFTFHVI
jgi:predicted MFS family arabinose efflux permease